MFLSGIKNAVGHMMLTLPLSCIVELTNLFCYRIPQCHPYYVGTKTRQLMNYQNVGLGEEE